MKFENILNENKKAILDDWFQAILESYPPDSINFFKNKKDQFQNPVGTTISKGIRSIFDEILNDFCREDIAAPLDSIVKIRSVQDFSPAQAVNFVFLLKDIIRNNVGKVVSQYQLEDELYTFECRIDRLALYAFENYMQCREKLCEIRVKQAKAGGFKILDRLNRKPEKAGHGSGRNTEDN